MFTFFFSVFIISWFIAGNAWVYQIVTKRQLNSKDVNDANYCDQTCYLVAFWIITSIWIIISLMCSLCCFCCFIVLILNRRNNINQTNITDNS